MRRMTYPNMPGDPQSGDPDQLTNPYAYDPNAANYSQAAPYPEQPYAREYTQTYEYQSAYQPQAEAQPDPAAQYPNPYPNQHPNQYPQQAYSYAPLPTDGFSVASLVLGILGFNVFAIVFGVIGLSRTSSGQYSGRGMAIAGIILGAISTVAVIFIFVIFFAAMGVALGPI